MSSATLGTGENAAARPPVWAAAPSSAPAGAFYFAFQICTQRWLVSEMLERLTGARGRGHFLVPRPAGLSSGGGTLPPRLRRRIPATSPRAGRWLPVCAVAGLGARRADAEARRLSAPCRADAAPGVSPLRFSPDLPRGRCGSRAQRSASLPGRRRGSYGDRAPTRVPRPSGGRDPADRERRRPRRRAGRRWRCRGGGAGAAAGPRKVPKGRAASASGFAVVGVPSRPAAVCPGRPSSPRRRRHRAAHAHRTPRTQRHLPPARPLPPRSPPLLPDRHSYHPIG